MFVSCHLDDLFINMTCLFRMRLCLWSLDLHAVEPFDYLGYATLLHPIQPTCEHVSLLSLQEPDVLGRFSVLVISGECYARRLNR